MAVEKTGAVEIQDVTKTFGRITAVERLSLVVPKGSVYGFIGPNGSGKTTTMRMIMNIIYPDAGTLRVFGEALSGAATDRIGYLPEERGLYKRMRVREVLEFYGELKSGRNVRRDVREWLARLDLADWAEKKVEALSKGMAQKVQFISAVATHPELLILDEPFTGLDPVNADVIREAVLDLQRNGTTVILSTHDMNIAEKMCDFILMIFRGRKVLDGTLESIQGKYGQDTIRVSTDDGLGVLENIPGVDKITDFGQVQELRMAPDCDPQQVLAAVMARTRVRSFEISKPSLHDIFVRIAGPEAEAATSEQARGAYRG